MQLIPRAKLLDQIKDIEMYSIKELITKGLFENKSITLDAEKHPNIDWEYLLKECEHAGYFVKQWYDPRTHITSIKIWI